MYKTHDIFVATGALIAATVVQVGVTWFLYKKVEKMQLATLAMVTVFGGLTIYLHDDNFIKWKVTIIYALFAISLLVSQYLGKPLIKSMLSHEIQLPERVWQRINVAWSLFFIVCACVNVYIAFRLPLDVWVNFKVFGLLIGTLIFTLATGGYIYHHMPKETDSE